MVDPLQRESKKYQAVASKFVLLDRDGTINQRVRGGYVTSWEQFTFLPGALDALRLLRQNHYATLVVSNQACIGKGLLDSAKLEEIHHRFVAEVERQGGRIHGVYYCPHREEDQCPCRKPKPGLLLMAQREHGFNFAEAVLIGDSETDLLAARAVGCTAILISNDYSDNFKSRPGGLRAVLPNLYTAARFLISSPRKPT